MAFTRAGGGYLLEISAEGEVTAGSGYEVKIADLRSAKGQDLMLTNAFSKYSQAIDFRRRGEYIEASSQAEDALKLLEIKPSQNAPRKPRCGALPTQEDKISQNATLPGENQKSPCSSYLQCSDATLTLGLLADLYRLRGEYDEADCLFSSADRMLEYLRTSDTERYQSLQFDHSLLLESYGQNSMAMGKESASHFKPALEIRERILGENNPKLSVLLDRLGDVYRDVDDYGKAEEYYKRALSIREMAEIPRPCDVITSRLNLATLNYLAGKDREAESLIGQIEKDPALSTCQQHSDPAGLFYDLGKLFHMRGEKGKGEENYDKAYYSFFLRAIEYQKTTFPKEDFPNGHPEVAKTKQAIADNWLARGNEKKGDLGNAIGNYDEARSIRENTLAPTHPDIAISLQRLARTYWDKKTRDRPRSLVEQAMPKERLRKKHIKDAVDQLERASQIAESNILRELLVGTEEHKVSYPKRFVDITNDLIWLNVTHASDDPQVTEKVLTAVLRNKGRVLNTVAGILEKARDSSPHCRELLDKLTEILKKESELISKESLTKREKDEIERLERERVSLYLSLNDCGAEIRSVTAGEVKAALPSDAILIEYAIYEPPGEGTILRDRSRYVAYVLTPRGVLPPVDLGDAELIDKQISLLLQGLRGKPSAGGEPILTPEEEVKKLARDLYGKALRDVLKSIQDMSLPSVTKRVLISSEGELNLVPFAALVDDDNNYLAQDPRYIFSYLTSGFDLLRMKQQAQRQGPFDRKLSALIFADPKYGPEAPQEAAAPGRMLDRDRGGNLRIPTDFKRIEGTGVEAVALKKLLPGVIIKQREKATEEAFKKLVGGRDIIHMAVHGFFLRDVRGNSHEDSMQRSGLALAGANLRQSGKDDDGILTARELSVLDLSRTQLAVFTSCEGGDGEVKRGEGVYGMRRALRLAGAESHVTSLWRVNDRGAAKLIIPFYGALLEGRGRSDSLREAQLCLLKDRNLNHPYYWAGFILAGQWTELSGLSQTSGGPASHNAISGICEQGQKKSGQRSSSTRARTR
jgi:CHAT domain-containing protein/tetratricopeptide (TPR) repeat protein